MNSYKSCSLPTVLSPPAQVPKRLKIYFGLLEVSIFNNKHASLEENTK